MSSYQQKVKDEQELILFSSVLSDECSGERPAISLACSSVKIVLSQTLGIVHQPSATVATRRLRTVSQTELSLAAHRSLLLLFSHSFFCY